MTLDIKKITKYPPEIFLEARPINLNAGENKVFTYVNLEYAPAYIAWLYGASFSQLNRAVFRVSVDGRPDVARIDDLGAVRGIDYDEEFKVPASKSLLGTIVSSTTVSNYQIRTKIRVDKSTPFLKYMLGLGLGPNEVDIASRLGFENYLAQPVTQYDPYTGIERLFTASKTFSESGTLLNIKVPDGYKVVILDISCTRSSSPNQASIAIYRDNVDLDPLDMYCMPDITYSLRWGSRHNYSIRIVALDEVRVDVQTTTAVKVRVVYGLGRVTIAEKIRWGVPLSASERRVAESQNLFDLVEAGLA